MSEPAPTDLVLRSVQGPVLTLTINRPEVRNCVDGPTAAALHEAFADFEADETLAVAVLTGAGGHFCAGADLKAVADPAGGRANRIDAQGPGPMGPSRMALSKPVIAAVSGYAVAGGAGTGLLVRPAGGRRKRRLRRVLPPLWRAAD